MTGVETRLAELGLTLPPVAAPAGSYVPAVYSRGTVYTSGQLPFVDGVLPATGKVGDGDGLVSPALAQDLARQSALNALAAASSVLGTLDRVVRVVKVVGFVASDPSFSGQPRVINGASDVLAQIFGDKGAHARSAVGVAALPLDSPVEVELVLEVED
ncbi:LysR family transcriptional regulator [Frondihabitans sp. PAMC 28766]|uniref:RidA family protein n=1 Tax=Frondihabitans sp. PAMC 28766 TaxID=1795630 RepID=UPI00078EB3AC|nr:RidA family protein [Frondihabitans sp. PAMC 28766]AMM21780.1 LysR family transcriptional regulator [Frondihabitans sp. PAMC 28766]